MNKTLAHRIRLLFEGQLDPEEGTGLLTEDELQITASLYQALTAAPDHDSSQYLKSLQKRTASVPGLLDQFRRGIALLQSYSTKRFSLSFDALAPAQQDAVLAQLLSGNVSPMSEPGWRYRMKMSRWHFDQIICPPAKRAFRQFVSADILSNYYRSDAGWKTVGYTEYPGKVRGEWEPCEVLQVHIDGDGLLLELSDTTFDRLLPDALELNGENSLFATTKYGRQKAKFSRAAYNRITEFLDSEGDSMVIRRGSQVWTIREGSSE